MNELILSMAVIFVGLSAHSQNQTGAFSAHSSIALQYNDWAKGADAPNITKENNPFLMVRSSSEARKIERLLQKHTVNFRNYIAANIPTYGDLQVSLIEAISSRSRQSGATIFEIGASEATFSKALADYSGQKITSTAIDISPEMERNYIKAGVIPGVNYQLAAFNSPNLGAQSPRTAVEVNGTKIPYFVSHQRFDYVIEPLVFQFMDPDRLTQLRALEGWLKLDGVAIIIEKVRTGEFLQNEELKDEFKLRFLSENHVKMKSSFLLNQMNNKMVSLETLKSNMSDVFAHRTRIWQSGNFVAFAVSNSQKALNSFNVAFVNASNPDFTASDLRACGMRYSKASGN
ncbi:MAG: hypothetical protein AB8E15_08260 [Bdellovibrionales bacterium]